MASSPVRFAPLLLVLAGCSASSPPPAQPAPTPPGGSAPGPAGGQGPKAPSGGPAEAGAGAKCAGGERKACDGLAELWGGRQIPRNEWREQAKQDLAALKTGCDEKKQAAACMGAALLLHYGHLTGKPQRGDAKPYWKSLKTLGDLNGFRKAAPSQSGKTALERTAKECKSGRARACNQLGWAAYEAVQRQKNLGDSQRHYARACKLGSGKGCQLAGHLAFTYPDLGQSGKASSLLERGCTLGFGESCSEQGVLLMRGKHNAQNFEQAMALFRQGCDLGSREACAHAGELVLLFPKAVDVDEPTARGWLDTACAAGSPLGCHYKAFQVLRDKTSGDGARAKAWKAVIKACGKGSEPSCAEVGRYRGPGKGGRCQWAAPEKPARGLEEAALKAFGRACKVEPNKAYCENAVPCKAAK